MHEGVILKRSLIATIISMCLVIALTTSAFARASLNAERTKDRIFTSAATPAYCLTSHDVGKLNLAVSNYGVFGAGSGFIRGSSLNCFTGDAVLSCEYPKGSRTRYLYAASFWVGAVVGRDTLVSVGADGWTPSQEMFPDEADYGGSMVQKSIMDPSRPDLFDGAVSEQDFIGVYTDTFTSGVTGLTNDEIDGRPHIPLHVEVTERSYGWSYPYAEDFVLFDYSIKNIGSERLRAVYMGIYVDADVYPEGQDASSQGFADDICGFIDTMNTTYGGCDWRDEVNLAWIADNDGDLLAANPPYLPNVTGMRIVRTPSDSLEVSFNWWVSNGTPALDFGPQRKGKVRDLGTGGLGTPAGDRNKYAFMRNNEFDYDQIYTASISPTNPDWEYPNQIIANDISDGYDTRYLLSFGPFNIDPGQTLPLSFAYVGGENLHTFKNNAKYNLAKATYNPDLYYDSLHFEDFALNSMWSSWIYDNPGVDTDSDGYAGEFRLCCNQGICDTVWYKGDGVPDFRGASPPPAPVVWVEPEVGSIRVRWNGFRSENTRDVFSRELDFEGYRVYLSRDSRETSYTLLSSYDIEDYNKWVYDLARREWVLKETPFTLEELRCSYGDSCNDLSFDPTRFSRSNPLRLSGTYIDDEGHEIAWDSTMYFAPQDFNRSIPGVTTEIRKIYPDQPYPSSLDVDSADASELTDDGYFKYFEYEYIIDNLLPTVPYYVNVTAFDYGSPSSGLASLETSKTIASKVTYAQETVQNVDEKNLKAYVYPNPYRYDANYADMGFEGRDALYQIPDRIRRVHWANLPARCTITVYTLDGDMVRQIEHDIDPADPTASHEEWDLITRNTQLVVSGIYYWTVEDPNGETQIGKLVIIM